MALLVAGIGIMNVMLMQVIERTREIGIRRAVGARRSAIALQFIMETLVQSVVGTLLGILLGLAASYGFCLVVNWTPHVRRKPSCWPRCSAPWSGWLSASFPRSTPRGSNPWTACGTSSAEFD